MQNKLKVGIIGMGVGESHIEGFQRHSGCEVVALCDFSDDKFRMCNEKYPHMKITMNDDDILQDTEIDIVSIASYDNYHYEQIIKALGNEKHVFVEKPLCMYESEAIEIREQIKSNPDLKLSSNLILRQSPRFLYVKNLIEEETFGELYYLESDYNYGRINKITDGWRGKLNFYSVVYGGGVHVVDLLLWLTGETIVEVFSYGNNISTKNSRFKYNDFVVSILKFKSGIVGKTACNMGCAFPHFHTLAVYGTKATFCKWF